MFFASRLIIQFMEELGKDKSFVECVRQTSTKVPLGFKDNCRLCNMKQHSQWQAMRTDYVSNYQPVKGKLK